MEIFKYDRRILKLFATDDVIINTGHTITNVNGGIIRAKSLNQRGGRLQFSITTNLILGN